MLNPEICTLYSGGASGAEGEFGAQAERHGVPEVNFTFTGHEPVRARGLRILTPEELREGNVSLVYLSKLMNRQYTDTPLLRRVLQSLWHQVSAGDEIYVIGHIVEDETVRGGTGWAAEFARLRGKPLFVFDQDEGAWFTWHNDHWCQQVEPVIASARFTGTGTRNLTEKGKRAIAELFDRSFGAAG